MRAELWSLLLTGFSISDLRCPSPAQILGTSSRFSEDCLGRERAPREDPLEVYYIFNVAVPPGDEFRNRLKCDVEQHTLGR